MFPHIYTTVQKSGHDIFFKKKHFYFHVTKVQKWQ